MSRPARGAWVEIPILIADASEVLRRAPQGARGLKFFQKSFWIVNTKSRPARGAWVEIFASPPITMSIMVAPRKGRVG